MTSSTDPNARQIGGEHYKVGGEEHWDRVHRLKLDYFQAQITRYVERCWKKNGLEDLLKAQHFLEKYIALNSPQPGPNEALKGSPFIFTCHRCGGVLNREKHECPAEPTGRGYVDQDGPSPRYSPHG